MDRKLRGIVTRQLEQDEQFPEGYIRAEYTEHIRPAVVGSLCDEVDGLRGSLNRLREWYNDSQAELQRTRNALGDLLARITLGECPLCGAIPAVGPRFHADGCPVPKALAVWDNDPSEDKWVGGVLSKAFRIEDNPYFIIYRFQLGSRCRGHWRGSINGWEICPQCKCIGQNASVICPNNTTTWVEKLHKEFKEKQISAIGSLPIVR